MILPEQPDDMLRFECARSQVGVLACDVCAMQLNQTAKSNADGFSDAAGDHSEQNFKKCRNQVQ